MTSNQEKTTDNIDDKKIDLAWKLVLDQFFEKVKKDSIEEGPGISIFRFLRTKREDDCNCRYFYTTKDGPVGKHIIGNSDFKSKIDGYDNTKHVIICVQIPLGFLGDETIGNAKIFDAETKKEIIFDENDEEENTHCDLEPQTLRRRKKHE